jgi:hexosaminidase
LKLFRRARLDLRPTDFEIIETAIEQTKTAILKQNIVPWQFHPRRSNYEPATAPKITINTVTLQQTRNSKAKNKEEDESYSLVLKSDGTAEISAPTAVGISYGLSSFAQLFYEHSKVRLYRRLFKPHSHLHRVEHTRH